MTDIVMDCKQDIGKGSARMSVARSMHFSQTTYGLYFSFFPGNCLGRLFRSSLSDFRYQNGRKTAFLVEFKTRNMSVSR